MEHRAKNKNDEVENQFDRLPDDVVVNFFDKVSDIKWLCRCLVVSKRFSSLIPLVQAVSVKTSAEEWAPFPVPNPDLVIKPLPYLLTLALLPPSLFLNVPPLVFHFKHMQSLNLDLVSDFNADNDSVFKLGAKFTSNLDSLTFLYAAFLSEKTMESEQEENETENEITQYEQIYRVNLATQWLKEAFVVAGNLVSCYPQEPDAREHHHHRFK
ncbi:hypothetical protein RHGRI_011338 [Rhododendron griersonianum]|uniref:F-box domain-containing protein n=1 Tax=Rhododendron griersonianum TaxID=479676 RepID=A0AAV6KMD7_9ERIC|nr:hypothetical protein RHGRI_011338 [Rhododendron griersonianum]